MAACYVHPEVASAGDCADCGKAICMRCTKGTLDGFMCPPCAHRRFGRRKLIVGLKVTAIGLAVAGVAVFGLMVVGRGSQRPKVEVPKPRDLDPVVAELLDTRDQAPCDRKVIRKLVDALGRADRHQEVVDHSTSFFAKCGPYPRLEWSVVHALQKLGRHAEAAKHSTVLIDDNPFDSDFWWWRGEDRVRANQPALGLADYRQSLANSQSDNGARFATARILDAAAGADRPCEGVFGVRLFVEHFGGTVASSLERRAAGMASDGGCPAQEGQGAARFTRGTDAELRAAVTIGAAEGQFIVDPRAGTTVLSSAFAARAGATGAGAAASSVAGNVVRTGPLATVAVTVGAASAAEVEVLIADKLPDGVDGYLGLSFLWRFATLELDDGVAVSDE